MTDRLERRLAAVVFTDMVGFTTMLEFDELAGREKRELYVDVIARFHDQYGGTVIKNLGDGTMSTFTSVLDATNAAVGIQRELLAREVSIRIGIHVGEVTAEDGDVVGEAVNIASRIESFSVPGGVLLSDAAYDQLRNRPEVKVISMGRYRLKNVRRPFELFAVAADGIVVPIAGSLAGKGEVYSSLPSNLPTPGTPLLGRAAVLSELHAVARAHRLVTITGPGGVGKTRLAIELGRQLMPDHPDGVAFASMADVVRDEEFLPALAAALDVKEAEDRSLGEGIVALITDTRAVLVLDNLENVVGAAPEVATLLVRCPGLTVIATSRTPLRLAAEQEFPLATLDVPADSTRDVAQLLDHSGIALFVDRASAVKPGFELTTQNAAAVVGICRRLDGLPLALELAAPRLRLLSPETLYDRLARTLDALAPGPRDAPERQQTLRGTIAWSHDLLTDTEQRLFRRLAVFVGGCSLEDLEAVCAEPGQDVLAELESLVDKALLRADSRGDRFSMLQTIAEFAGEQLESAGESAVISQRHARRYAALARELRDAMEGEGQIDAIERGIVEEGNLQSALDALLASARDGDAEALEVGLSACGDLYMYWHVRGKNVSGQDRALSFLAADRAEAATVGRCGALITAGLASWVLGDFESSIATWEQSRKLAEQLAAARELCISEFVLGLGYLGLADETGRQWSASSLERSRSAGFVWAEGLASTVDGMFCMLTGDMGAADVRFQAALKIQRRLGDEEGAGLTLGGLAALAAGGGDLDRALELYEQSLGAFEACGDRAEEARILSEMAWTALGGDDVELARHRFLDSIQAYTDIASVRGIGGALTGLAATEAAEGSNQRAALLAAAAEVYARAEGIVNVYSDETPGREWVERARAALPGDVLSRASSTGRSLALSDAIDFARRGRTSSQQ